MTLATTFLAAALVVPSMQPPEFEDIEVDASYSREYTKFSIRLR